MHLGPRHVGAEDEAAVSLLVQPCRVLDPPQLAAGRFQGSGCRVQGVGVRGSGFRVWGLELRIPDLREVKWTSSCDGTLSLVIEVPL